MPKPRHRLRYWTMAGFSVFCVLVGLASLVLAEDRETRLSGVMIVLFFGLGPLNYLGTPLLTRRGQGEIRIGRAGGEPAFVFPAPAAKTALQLLAGIGLGGGAVLLYVLRGGWVTAACAVVFVLFLLLAVYRVFRPLQLVITPTWVIIGSTRMRWEDIEDVDLYEMPAGNTTVDMVGIDAERYEQPRWMEIVGRIGRRWSAYDVVVGADSLSRPGEEIVEVLEQYRRHADRRRHIGAAEELARLHRLPDLAGRT
jgi:hypothetical protein